MIRFDELTINDAVSVTEIEYELDNEGKLNWQEMFDFIVAAMKAPSSRYIGAWIDGALVAFVAIRGEPDGSRSVGFAVRKAWQRRGIGTELLKRSMASADPETAPTLARVAVENRPSRTTLERAGFVLVGPVVDQPGKLQYRRDLT